MSRRLARALRVAALERDSRPDRRAEIEESFACLERALPKDLERLPFLLRWGPPGKRFHTVLAWSLPGPPDWLCAGATEFWVGAQAVVIQPRGSGYDSRDALAVIAHIRGRPLDGLLLPMSATELLDGATYEAAVRLRPQCAIVTCCDQLECFGAALAQLPLHVQGRPFGVSSGGADRWQQRFGELARRTGAALRQATGSPAGPYRRRQIADDFQRALERVAARLSTWELSSGLAFDSVLLTGAQTQPDFHPLFMSELFTGVLAAGQAGIFCPWES